MNVLDRAIWFLENRKKYVAGLEYVNQKHLKFQFPNMKVKDIGNGYQVITL